MAGLGEDWDPRSGRSAWGFEGSGSAEESNENSQQLNRWRQGGERKGKAEELPRGTSPV